jgi:hypothetical protein
MAESDIELVVVKGRSVNLNSSKTNKKDFHRRKSKDRRGA